MSRVRHLVIDCQNKEAKDAWLVKKETRQSRDEPRGRKHDRQPRERSDSRDNSRGRSQEREARSPSRERYSRDRPNDRDFKKKKKISQKWMSSDVEDLSDGDDSGDGFMVGGEVEDDEEEQEEVEGDRIARALHAGASPDLVCIDSECNRVLLFDAEGISEYIAAIRSFLHASRRKIKD